MADPVDDYFKSISPYDQPAPSATSQAAPSATATGPGGVKQVARDLGVFAGQLPVGAGQLVALPFQAGAAAIGHPDWIPSNEAIQNELTMGPTAATPEEERFAAMGRGAGAGLPLLALPITRPYAAPVAMGGGVGGLVSKSVEQAWPDSGLLAPVAGMVAGGLTGMIPGIATNPGAFMSVARRLPSAIELGWLRSIAIEHGAQRAGEMIGNLLGSPMVGSMVGSALHWGPVVGPALTQFARNAVGAVPGALSGLFASRPDRNNTATTLNPFTAP